MLDESDKEWVKKECFMEISRLLIEEIQKLDASIKADNRRHFEQLRTDQEALRAEMRANDEKLEERLVKIEETIRKSRNEHSPY